LASGISNSLYSSSSSSFFLLQKARSTAELFLKISEKDLLQFIGRLHQLNT
jgi:hypothetical protein